LFNMTIHSNYPLKNHSHIPPLEKVHHSPWKKHTPLLWKKREIMYSSDSGHPALPTPTLSEDPSYCPTRIFWLLFTRKFGQCLPHKVLWKFFLIQFIAYLMMFFCFQVTTWTGSYGGPNKH
jgi:hypothetical protein